MHVLQVCNVFPPFPHGGIGSTVADLAPALAERCTSFAIAGHYRRELAASELCRTMDRESPFPIHRFINPFPPRPHRIVERLSRLHFKHCLRRLWKNNPWDVIISQDYEGPLPFGPPGSAPHIAMLHGSNFVYDDLMQRPGDALVHRLEKATLRHATTWSGVSDFILQETIRRLPPSANTRLTVTYNAVDCARFARPPGISPIPGRIVYHNSVRPRKGIIDLIDAMPAICDRIPNAVLHVYGSCEDFGTAVDSLTQRLPPNLRPKVCFHGRIPRDQLPSKLHEAHVACYPSHLETFGIAPVEAMAAGCLTIYTDAGPGPEIMEHGISGLLTPPRDPHTLARTIISALEMPEQRRSAITRAGTETAIRRFDRSTAVEQAISLIQNM